MEAKGTYYYKIPTVAGDFYFYREYIQDDDPYYPTKFDCFREFFTGLTIGENIYAESLDLDDEEDNFKFGLIKDELTKSGLISDKELEKKNLINYSFIYFPSSVRGAVAGFPYINYKDVLPYDTANFIIGLVSKETEVPYELNYKIDIFEFTNGIQETISKYGSIEKARLAILEKIRYQALVSEDMSKAISDKHDECLTKKAKEEFCKIYL